MKRLLISSLFIVLSVSVLEGEGIRHSEGSIFFLGGYNHIQTATLPSGLRGTEKIGVGVESDKLFAPRISAVIGFRATQVRSWRAGSNEKGVTHYAVAL